MNKYEKALNDLIYEITPFSQETYNKRDIKLLKILVERATPIKPIKKDGWLSCPNCNATLPYNGANVYREHCGKCGKKIDWSNNE